MTISINTTEEYCWGEFDPQLATFETVHEGDTVEWISRCGGRHLGIVLRRASIDWGITELGGDAR